MGKKPFPGGGSPPIVPKPSTGGGGTGGTSGSTRTLGESVEEGAQTEVSQALSIIPVEFGIVNVTASLSASRLYRMNPGSTSQANQVGVTMPYRGSVAAISFTSNAAKSAGTCSFTVYIDGAATTATATWTTGDTEGYANISSDIASFTAGQIVDVRVTTDGSMSPTTNDVIVTLFLLLNPQTVL